MNYKNILCASVSLLAAHQALAADFEDNRIDSLHYRPAQTHFEAGAYVESYLPDAEKTKQGGTQTTSSRKQQTSLGASLNYGIRDDLDLELAESYLLIRRSTNSTSKTNAQTSTNSEGLSDPTITMNYRYFGGLVGSKFGSVYLSLEPALGTAKSATVDQDGNDLASSTSIELGTSFTWVLGISELSLSAEVTDHTSGSSTPVGQSSAVTTKTYANYDVAAAYRFHFCDHWFVEPALTWTGPYASASTNPNRSPTLQDSSHYPARLASDLELGWRAADKLLLDLNYSYTTYTQAETTNAGKTRNSYSYPQQQGILKLAASYEI